MVGPTKTHWVLINLIYKAKLKPIEAQILEHRLLGETLAHIGINLNLTAARIGQLEMSGLRKLQHPLRFAGVANRIKKKENHG